MSELIERFRYRFQLWRRERREDYIGPPGTLPTALESKLSDDPKRKVVLTESTPMFIIRALVSYFVPVAI
jgi:hypothetical protein